MGQETILVGFDNTPQGRDALALAMQMSQTYDLRVTVASVYPGDERGLIVAVNDSKWVGQVRREAEHKLDAARTIVGDAHDVEFRALGTGSAARLLYEYAEQERPYAVVVGSSAHAALGRIAPGSTVERLLHGVSCPVLVAPRGYHEERSTLAPVAVAFDGSPEAEYAADLAAELAKETDTALRLVAVADRSARPELTQRMEAVLDRTGVPGSTEVIEDGEDVSATLADLPGDAPGLLVCGSRGYGPLRQVFLGSVSVKLVRHAAYPVMVVPRPGQ